MIRTAKIEDSARLAEIHVCGWRYAYRYLISDKELFSDRLVIKSFYNFEKNLKLGTNIFVFEDDDIIKGFAWHRNCLDDDNLDAYELTAIYMQPEYIRNGIGTKLLIEVEKYAKNIKKEKIVIWALENNIKAINFYEKNNYKKDGKFKNIEEWNQKEIRFVKDL